MIYDTDAGEDNQGLMNMYYAPIWVLAINLVVYLAMMIPVLAYVSLPFFGFGKLKFVPFHVCVVVFSSLRLVWAVMALISNQNEHWKASQYAVMYVFCGLGFCFFFTSFLLVLTQIHASMRGRWEMSKYVRIVFWFGNAFLYLFVIFVAIMASGHCSYDETSEGITRVCRENVDRLMFASDVALILYTFLFAAAFFILTFILDRKVQQIRKFYLTSSTGHLSPKNKTVNEIDTEVESLVSSGELDSLNSSSNYDVGAGSPEANRIEHDVFLIWVVCIVCVVCFTSRCITFVVGFNFDEPYIVLLLFGYWVPEIPCSLMFLYVMRPPPRRKGEENTPLLSETPKTKTASRISRSRSSLYDRDSVENTILIEPSLRTSESHPSVPIAVNRLQEKEKQPALMFEVGVSVVVRSPGRLVVALLEKDYFAPSPRRMRRQGKRGRNLTLGDYSDMMEPPHPSPESVEGFRLSSELHGSRGSRVFVDTGGELEIDSQKIPRFRSQTSIDNQFPLTPTSERKTVSEVKVHSSETQPQYQPDLLNDIDRTEVVLKESREATFNRTLRFKKEKVEDDEPVVLIVFSARTEDPENLQLAECIGKVEFHVKDLAVEKTMYRPILALHTLEDVGEMRLSMLLPLPCCSDFDLAPTGVKTMAGYVFPTTEETTLVRVHEHLIESPCTFTAPLELLRLIRPVRDEQLRHLKQHSAEVDERFNSERKKRSSTVFGGAMESVRSTHEHHLASKWYDQVLENMNCHVEAIDDALVHFGSLCHQGVTFKSSEDKATPNLRFAATNLHLQDMTVWEPMIGQEPVRYQGVTVGAPAAHAYKFRNGMGLRQLIGVKKKKQKLLEKEETKLDRLEEQEQDQESIMVAQQLQREVSQLELEIEQRMDVVMCQALGALVSSFTLELELKHMSQKWMVQLCHMGFPIQFESLLSTHGAEMGMLGDMDVAVSVLSRFSIRIEAETETRKAGTARVSRASSENLSFTGREAVNTSEPPLLRIFDSSLSESELGEELSLNECPFSPSKAPLPGLQPSATQSKTKMEKVFSAPDLSDFHLIVENTKTSTKEEEEEQEQEEEEEDTSITEGKKSPELTGSDFYNLETKGEEKKFLPRNSPVKFSEAVNKKQYLSKLTSVVFQKSEETEKREMVKLQRDLLKLRSQCIRGPPPGLINTSANDAYIVTIYCRKEVFNRLHPLLQKGGKPLEVIPLFFTQGINEQQTVALLTGESVLQEEINKENLFSLGQCYLLYRRYLLSQGESESTNSLLRDMDFLFSRICKVVVYSHAEKNTEILPLTSDFCRRMNGGRVTCCKSAKDRTSMSVTWEQARLLQYYHNVGDVGTACNVMRTNGVRRENAFKNIGKNKFAFNKFQRRALPQCYRPPEIVGGARKS